MALLEYLFLMIFYQSIKVTEKEWEDIKHIIISLINEYYSSGKKYIYEKSSEKNKQDTMNEIEKKIIKILRDKN